MNVETTILIAPAGLQEAIAEWNANCGPAALAATLGVSMAAVRDFFPRFPAKPWCNPTHMVEAIRLAGRKYALTPYCHRIGRGRACPAHGVAFLQFSSPEIDAMPVLAQYKKTHWVATFNEHGYDRPSVIYDINAGGWVSANDWHAHLWPRFQEATGATTFWCRSAYEIDAKDPPCHP